MLRQRVKLENRRIGQGYDTIDSGQVRNECAAAHIDEDVLGSEPVPAHLHLARRKKARVAAVNRATLHALKPGFDARSCSRHDHVLARLHGLHVNRDLTRDTDAIFDCAARQVRRIGTSDERFGRGTAGIDTGAAKELALDQTD